MTRVDFYILQQDDERGRPLLACRLADKAFRLGHKVYIHTDSESQTVQLDELLWTFSAGSFVPHAPFSEEALASHPVLIGHDAEPHSHIDVLVNLAAEVPLFFSRFDRVAEIIGGDAEQKHSGRERYRFYRDRGYALETHNV